MPTYDYQCRSCGTVTEVIHSMIEEGPTACERCGGELRRILYPAGIIFKGSGFYRTDSRSKSSTKSADASKAGTDSGSASGSPAKPSSDRSGPDRGGSSGSESEKGQSEA